MKLRQDEAKQGPIEHAATERDRLRRKQQWRVRIRRGGEEPIRDASDAALVTDPSDSRVGPLFVLERVGKAYGSGDLVLHALRDVSLEVRDGEMLALLGASGSGKSTLLNLLGGLDVPTEGRVLYRGRDLAQAGEPARTAYRRHDVGFVFQLYNLMPSLTARENVALVTEVAREPMPPEEALELVGLGQRMDHFPGQLSGGEQQRVAIARAIAKRPTVLLCDEPTGALDTTTGIAVLEAIANVQRRLAATVVMITHNASLAEMADRVVRLSDGRVVESFACAHKREPKDLRW